MPRPRSPLPGPQERPCQDPVLADRRTRRKRAVIAGLLATAILGGGLASGLEHSCPPPAHTTRTP
ncbi:hypothetical protein K7472_03520 [Streptomyces sp. PTM05]|uniref:Uncharacterized protein n=1 Tax=Streptantibioticus parmotrematis TaxID=2873249 RepID=A0ABS7QL40_9ACTN|nr:hypothetical protein [Streptantibioticus parmotrematis]MBY8883910.1 hypothetical protein [Streptantibioticus parmotrematis]